MSETHKQSGFCRDCFSAAQEGVHRCIECAGRRITHHNELFSLSVAHLDCDAFYAAIEKRDRPELADKPVIIGGGRRGVVMTGCYVARTFGIRSAMPMFKALQACPHATVISSDMAKYATVAEEVRRLMRTLTPLVEPLSVDEAFLDLSGTERIHGAPPAITLARLQKRIALELRITASIGLSHNKFLAKIASDLDKPNGFSVIGRAETRSFLAKNRISIIWGVGTALNRRLEKDGLTTIGQLQEMDPKVLASRYGEVGWRLARLAIGEDTRAVIPDKKVKSISSETTFDADISDLTLLEDKLWMLCEKVSMRMKQKAISGQVITLKLKTSDFKTLTRRRTLENAGNLARTAFATSRALLREAAHGRSFRLIGVGYSNLVPSQDNQQPMFFESDEKRFGAQENAIDRIRLKFGSEAIGAGRSLRKSENSPTVRKK